MTTRDARSVSEEGFHEIQLSGKQLVFLFMATTVVSVVIFLCGVLVGRGVRADAAVPDLGAATPGGGTVASAGPSEDSAAAQPAAAAAGTSSGDEIDYHKQLTAAQASDPAVPVDETVAPATEPAPASAASDRERTASVRPEAAATATKPLAVPPAAKPEPEPARPAPAAAAPAGGNGIVVQVTALKNKSEAEAVAARLVRRGYSAFVLEPQPGSAPFYRVRVGPFADQAAADQAVKRLSREEKFKPWISR